MSLTIEIRQTKQNGLELYKIYVNGTFLRSFWSKEMAEHKSKQLLHAWSNEGLAAKAVQRKQKNNEKVA